MFSGISLEPMFLLTVFVDAAVISAGLFFGSWLMGKILSGLKRSSQPSQPKKE